MGVPEVRDGHQDERDAAEMPDLWLQGVTFMRGTRRPSTSKPGDPRLPLAAARERLKRKPGRARKAESGHVPGTPSAGRGVNGGLAGGTLAVQASEPRLLSLDDTARYLGVSAWTVRDLEAAGVLTRVRIPLPNGADLRKLLFDREDLDRLIEGWKER